MKGKPWKRDAKFPSPSWRENSASFSNVVVFLLNTHSFWGGGGLFSVTKVGKFITFIQRFLASQF